MKLWGLTRAQRDKSGLAKGPGRDKLPINEVGSEPDPRFTLANERTFLAWNRTAIALIAAGLAASQLLRFGVGGAHLLIGLPLIAVGIVVALSSYRRWERVERALRTRTPLEYFFLQRWLAISIALVAAVSLVLVVVDVLIR